MKISRISNGEIGNYLYFVAVDQSNRLVALSYFERTKSAVQAMGAWIKRSGQQTYGAPMSINTFDGENMVQQVRLSVPASTEFEVYSAPFSFGMDRANIAFVYNKEIGTKYVLTTKEWLEEDFYNVLMNRYSLPLLREWTPYIMEELRQSGGMTDKGKLFSMPGARIPFHRGAKKVMVPMKELILLELGALENDLENILKKGLSKGFISFTDKPQKALELGQYSEKASTWDLNTYMQNYGNYLNKNVEDMVHPMIPLIDNVEGYAGKTKRLFPQQAAVVNGLIALAERKERYGFANCGMGCGKTVMAMATVEGCENQKWLRKHPGKTLRDMYLSNEQPKYRAVVMPPSHLVDKWKREIESEVPNAQVTILNDLADLVALRARGREPRGREWYIVSKDFAKLDGGVSPIPTNLATGMVELEYCKTCYNPMDGRNPKMVAICRDKNGRKFCPDCGERNPRQFFFDNVEEHGFQRGLVCPHCGKLLLNKKKAASGRNDDSSGGIVLKPRDFAEKTDINSFCFHCNHPLWGYNCEPVGGVAREPKWYKVSYYKNFSKKQRVTSWVLKNHEQELYLSKNMVDEDGRVDEAYDVQTSPRLYNSRKVAPATYIKKYLKGFWDYVILDEVHKYEGAGTAQMQAAHALVKTGKFTLGLTGTLTNGKADSLYYLFWMLEPQTMKEKGFKFSSSSEFSQQYGCVETVYEAGAGYAGGYGKLSKGRILKRPRTKPGINPVVYSEFLLGHAISMDLSDLTKYMPPLHEYVELIPLPDDVRAAYQQATKVLSDEAKKVNGACLQGEALTFSLSYPDKPYGRMSIMHPKVKDMLVMNPPNLDRYQNTLLPKEERIVEIVKKEMEEGRNIFIFANFTGKAESNITDRLQGIIEKECSLKGRVMVLKADTPVARKREAFIHEKAKAGIKVVITNAKVCETGLDFCWTEDDIFYNYPTIIFAQPTYELAVMMQASRRHYRLNQKEECRTYWMAYENTLQAAALQIMAAKQVAAAAIQGKFSAEGLASMAQGVDSRVMLAQKLASGDNSSREELASMFDVLARNNAEDEDSEGDSYIPQRLFFEIMGEDYVETEIHKIPTLLDAFEGSVVAAGSIKTTYTVNEMAGKTTTNQKSGESAQEAGCGFFDGKNAGFFGGAIMSSIFQPAEIRYGAGKKRRFVPPKGMASFFD